MNLRPSLIALLLFCLAVAACATTPGVEDYGLGTDVQNIRVIIAPQGPLPPDTTQGRPPQPPLPASRKPYFNYRIGVFNFLAPSDRLGRQLARMSHEHMLNFKRFRSVGLIDEAAPMGRGPGRLMPAVERGRELGYDLILVGECLDLFSGITTAPSRAGFSLRIIDTKRAQTVWLIVGQRAVRPSERRDFYIFQKDERPAPDAMAVAHYLLQAMLDKL